MKTCAVIYNPIRTNITLKAKEKNVVVGAHIGFNDIQGFGYRPVELKEDELEALVSSKRQEIRNLDEADDSVFDYKIILIIY